MPPSLAGDTPRSVCHPGEGTTVHLLGLPHAPPPPAPNRGRIGMGMPGAKCAGCSLWASLGFHGQAGPPLGSWLQGLWGQAWIWLSAPTGWPGAQTYRSPRVAWRAGGSRHTGAEEATTSRLAFFSFLPTVPSVTLFSLWIERLV